MYLTRIIKKIASCFDIEISRKRKPLEKRSALSKLYNSAIPDKKSVVPRANCETIPLVMQILSDSKPRPTVIQVGANDGETSDSIYSFIKTGKFESYLIEPIPSTYEKLKFFYSGVAGVNTVNAAISSHSGTAEIFSVKDEGRWLGDAWATQLASFDKSHLLRHGILEEEIEIINVPSMTFVDLVREKGLGSVDVLVVDVEGFDSEIVSMALDSGLLPKCLYFEYIQFVRRLDQDEVDRFYEKLLNAGYSWAHDRVNTLALHSSFIQLGKQALPNLN